MAIDSRRQKTSVGSQGSVNRLAAINTLPCTAFIDYLLCKLVYNESVAVIAFCELPCRLGIYVGAHVTVIDVHLIGKQTNMKRNGRKGTLHPLALLRPLIGEPYFLSGCGRGKTDFCELLHSALGPCRASSDSKD